MVTSVGTNNHIMQAHTAPAVAIATVTTVTVMAITRVAILLLYAVGVESLINYLIVFI